MENRKTYTEVTSLERVITSQDDAVDAVVEVMDQARFGDKHLVRTVLSYIDKVIKEEYKAEATVGVIRGLADALPQIKVAITKDGKDFKGE
jgi:hypothetical protein